MNFHKTIGYLAALLLMVGLGVPDSFAQTDVDVDTLNSQLRPGCKKVRPRSVTCDCYIEPTAPGAGNNGDRYLWLLLSSDPED